MDSEKCDQIIVFSGKRHYGCSPHHHGLDMDSVYEEMNKLGQAKNIVIIQKVRLFRHLQNVHFCVITT